jgi:hypothetical protein
VAGELGGEEAFRKILSWRNGSFETFPPDSTRERTVFKSYSALLLESAQALDESLSEQAKANQAPENTPFAKASVTEGMEFILAMSAQNGAPQSKGLENPGVVGKWSQQTLERFRKLGEQLQAGPMDLIEVVGPTRRVTLSAKDNHEFCLGWNHALPPADTRELTRKVMELWAS